MRLTSVGVALGQSCRRLTGIEPAMGSEPELGGWAYIVCMRYIHANRGNSPNVFFQAGPASKAV